MDHTGAVVGPLLATAFLLAFPDRYRTLFALDGDTRHRDGRAVAVGEGTRSTRTRAQTLIPNPQSLIPDTKLALPSPLIRYLIVLSVFTLGNSADAFLLLRLTEAAGGPQFIPLFWSLLHVVKMGASLVGGSASDRIGRRPLIAAGWIVYAVVYAGFAMSTSLSALLSWFFAVRRLLRMRGGDRAGACRRFRASRRTGNRVRYLQRRLRNRRAGVERGVRPHLE